MTKAYVAFIPQSAQSVASFPPPAAPLLSGGGRAAGSRQRAAGSGQTRHNAAERTVHPEHIAPCAVCADSRRAHGLVYVKFAVALPK